MVNVIISLINLVIVFLIDFLVYRNARDFCVLILHLATLQNSLTSNSFLVASFVFSMYGIERLLLNHEKRRDSWPPEKKNSIRGQRRGLIAQSFCVTKFY